MAARLSRLNVARNAVTLVLREQELTEKHEDFQLFTVLAGKDSLPTTFSLFSLNRELIGLGRGAAMIDLTEVETRAVLKLRSGELFRPNCDRRVPEAGQEQCRIRASVLRATILGTPLLPAEQGQRLTPPAAIRLEGVEIVGELEGDADSSVESARSIDLRSLRGTHGGAAPALILHYCLIPDRFLVSHGHFTQISLKHSRFVEIVGKQVVVDGQVNLSDTASPQACAVYQDTKEAGGGKQCCSVNLRGAVIKGNLKASRAVLSSPPYNEDLAYSLINIPYALQLAGAQVQGSLILQPGFEARGGVGLSNSRIGGNIWLQGSTLTAEPKTQLAAALDLLQAHVMGSVVLSAWLAPKQEGLYSNIDSDAEEQDVPLEFRHFKAKGTVFLYGAQIDGELYMPGAILDPFNEHSAINATHVQVRKRVRASVQMDLVRREISSVRFESKGKLDFSFADIGGFEATGALFKMEKCSEKGPEDKVVLDLSEAHIRGDLLAQPHKEVADDSRSDKKQYGTEFIGAIKASDTQVDGRVRFSATEIECRGLALDLSNTRVGHAIVLVDGTRIKKGGISLADTSIGSDLMLYCCELGANGEQSIAAEGLHVVGTLGIDTLASAGALTFYAAHIDRDVCMRNIKCCAGAITMAQAIIAGLLDIKNCALRWPFDISFAQVGGSAWLNKRHSVSKVKVGKRFEAEDRNSDDDDTPEMSIDATGIEISGNLSIYARTCSCISFSLARIQGETSTVGIEFVVGAGATPELLLKGANFEGGLELPAASMVVKHAVSPESLSMFQKQETLSQKLPRPWSIASARGNPSAAGSYLFLYHEKRDVLVPLPPDRVVGAVKVFGERHRSRIDVDSQLGYLVEEALGRKGQTHIAGDSDDLGMRWGDLDLPGDMTLREERTKPDGEGLGFPRSDNNPYDLDAAGRQALARYYKDCIVPIRLAASHASYLQDQSNKNWITASFWV